MNEITLALVCALLAYIIGSIPTGYIVVRLIKGEDIRKIGSGSTGATNVKRVLGKNWFFAVMLLDALKGALPVLGAKYFAVDDIGLNAVLAAVMVLIGHSKSIFLGFSGGKSVASGVGTILALNPFVGLGVAAIWGVVTWFSRYVSLGSIVAISFAPLLMLYFKAPSAYVYYACAGALYIIWLHRENIKRLAKGEENKVR